MKVSNFFSSIDKQREALVIVYPELFLGDDAVGHYRDQESLNKTFYADNNHFIVSLALIVVYFGLRISRVRFYLIIQI